jgi:peroxiredoxin
MIQVNVEPEIMEQMRANDGRRLVDISFQQPVMLVFLRPFGCIFCREALSDISNVRERIEESGVKIVFVHMAADEIAERYFARYGLNGAVHIGDPECRYYAAFGLVKGTFTQLFGLQSWIRGFKVSVLDGRGAGQQLGDGFQMPGIFIIQDGEIKESFVHKLVSDRPDYEELMKCCTI